MDDYRGPFDPDVQLSSLSRRALAALGREYMLFGHFLNRAGLPAVHAKLGAEARERVAIEEWIGASPIYTRRMQQAMGITGNDVETIFKGLQLDVGFAHQYMDVRYQLDGPERGYFWLQSCGALLELEPHGEAAVFSMCHTIEDPTFDATAVATNPRARCRPIHRPPRQPVDRVPHCRWEVFVDHGAEPVRPIPLQGRVAASRLAQHAFDAIPAGEPGGRPDYRGPFLPDFQLDDLSQAALVRVCRELLVQDHLLVRALMMAVADRGGIELAQRVALAQWAGTAPVVSQRLQAALGIAGHNLDAILKVVQFHPAFVPGYAPVSPQRVGAERARLAITPCAALEEGDVFSWWALLDAGAARGLEAMVQAVDPRARCVPAAPMGSERRAWEIVIDPAAEPAPEPPEAAMVHATRAARFAFAAPGARV